MNTRQRLARLEQEPDPEAHDTRCPLCKDRPYVPIPIVEYSSEKDCKLPPEARPCKCGWDPVHGDIKFISVFLPRGE
jgi:hypothetical protein